MIRARGVLVLAALFVAVGAAGADPSSAIGQGRSEIAAKQYQDAIETLQAAIPEAVAIEDRKHRNGALAAIHFYSAVAFSAWGQQDKAREQLAEFFRFQPEASKIDRKIYGATFTALFDEVRSEIPASLETMEMFDDRYPGFAPGAMVAPRETPAERWNESPDFQLLATDAERRAWDRARDEDDRQQVIFDFWRVRDPDPSTEKNELKEEFERRVAFANLTFVSERGPGSLTDRGRVFVLLGVPARVHTQPLTRRLGAFLPGGTRTNALPGTFERWVYFRSQLPVGMPKAVVEFQFVDEPGYGEYVLNRQFFQLKALDDAREAMNRER